MPSVTRLPAGSDVEMVATDAKRAQPLDTEESPMRYNSNGSLHASLMVPEIAIPFNWFDFNVDYRSSQYSH